jgi:hypothetical protein
MSGLCTSVSLREQELRFPTLGSYDSNTRVCKVHIQTCSNSIEVVLRVMGSLSLISPPKLPDKRLPQLIAAEGFSLL